MPCTPLVPLTLCISGSLPTNRDTLLQNPRPPGSPGGLWFPHSQLARSPRYDPVVPVPRASGVMSVVSLQVTLTLLEISQ